MALVPTQTTNMCTVSPFLIKKTKYLGMTHLCTYKCIQEGWRQKSCIDWDLLNVSGYPILVTSCTCERDCGPQPSTQRVNKSQGVMASGPRICKLSVQNCLRLGLQPRNCWSSIPQARPQGCFPCWSTSRPAQGPPRSTNPPLAPGKNHLPNTLVKQLWLKLLRYRW